MRTVVMVLGLILCSGCAPAMRDLKPALTVADSGTIWFASAGSLIRTEDFRLIAGEPVVLSGDLKFPAGGGPFAAIILTHGCSGLGNAERSWEPELRGAGYATFVVDSFGGRGLREVCTSVWTLLGTQRIPDAYGALRIVATHPRIDPRRIALMGFSHGGILTLDAATMWARETYAPPGHASFRAFFPFYPYCNTVFPERSRVSAPVRIHTGELDDWTPARPCQDLAAALKAAGHDVEITVYRGARHSFDNVGRPLGYLPSVDSAASCVPRAQSITGPLLNPVELGQCLRKGATIGWSPAATAEARRNVRTQLAELLK